MHGKSPNVTSGNMEAGEVLVVRNGREGMYHEGNTSLHHRLEWMYDAMRLDAIHVLSRTRRHTHTHARGLTKSCGTILLSPP